MLQPTSPVKVTIFNFLIRISNAVGGNVAETGALLDIVHTPVADVARVVIRAAVCGVALVDLAWSELTIRGYASRVRRDSSRRSWCGVRCCAC
jgi:hypothetical protein